MVQAKFPGLRQPESIILAAWHKSHAPAGASFEYNVPVGKGIDPPDWLPKNLHGMARKNSQRKIDALMTHGNAQTIIEVKERAQLGSIGQLLGYAHLWQSENPGQPHPGMMLLTARLSPGVREVAEKHGISVVVVPADFGAITGAV